MTIATLHKDKRSLDIGFTAYSLCMLRDKGFRISKLVQRQDGESGARRCTWSLCPDLAKQDKKHNTLGLIGKLHYLLVQW